MIDETPVTEVQGEESEGKVLQAIAGEGNMYFMLIIEFDDDGAMNMRLPSNMSEASIKAAMSRVQEIL